MTPRKVAWTTADNRQLADLCETGKTAAEIAEVMGRSAEDVRRRITNAGFKGRIRLLPRRNANNDY